MSTPLLDGLRVLEIGEPLAASVCGRMFAELGAEVLQLRLPEAERPPASREAQLAREVTDALKREASLADLETLAGEAADQPALLAPEFVVDAHRPGLVRHRVAVEQTRRILLQRRQQGGAQAHLLLVGPATGCERQQNGDQQRLGPQAGTARIGRPLRAANDGKDRHGEPAGPAIVAPTVVRRTHAVTGP